MSLYEKIINKQEKIAVVGLGYVGMPIAVAFAKKVKVIGFDLNRKKIELYKSGIDPTNEVGNMEIKSTTVEFTVDEKKLKDAKFYIVAVPTPINMDKTPDLTPVEMASTIVGRNLTKGSIIVYESTVYPGVTEDICIPILEKESGLSCGIDFKVGYSPERINPGDKVHTLDKIIKIVSGMDEESLEEIAKVYELVIEAGVHKASSIKVAEAAKVIENSQRDINIAFMNELSMVFNQMGIDTKSVLEAAETKWNFLKFTPGLVGGHCIGVDPYYFIYKAEQLGYHSQIILAGRKINDDMGKYVASNIIKNLIKAGQPVRNAKIAVLGLSFKENCPDVRNTKVIDVINELKEYGSDVIVYDSVVNKEEVLEEYKIELVDWSALRNLNCIVFAVAHDEFKGLKLEHLKKLYRICDTNNGLNAFKEVSATLDDDSESNKQVLIDLKGIFDKKQAEEMNYLYWRL